MLPSRGIVRSLPPAGAYRHLTRRAASSPSIVQPNGRQFGTLRRSGLSAGQVAHLRPRYEGLPLAFGSVAAPRAFSLWGYGSKSSPDPEAVAASADASTTQAVVGRPQENLAETVAAADASSPSLAATPPPPADPSSTTQQGLDAISDIVNSSGSEILSREEGFGYLSSLGLDYGWGPTSAMQWLLEHMHVWTGLGWGGSIIATAFVLRALMFYPQIRSTIFSHKMRKLQEDPRFKQAQAEGRRGMLERDQAASQTSRYLTSLVKKEYDVDNKQFLWALAPIPFSFGLFRAVTGMVAIPVPALESAGYMWFTDLTASDPFMVLPALATGMMMLSLKINSRNQTAEQKAMMTKVSYVLVPIMLIGTSYLSAAVNLMGTAFGIATLASTALLNNNTIRRAFRMPVLEPPALTPKVAPVPARQYVTKAYTPDGIRERLTGGLEDVKKGWSDSVAKATGGAKLSDADKSAKKVKETLAKLEETRREKERAHFEEKYKGKR